MQVEMSLAELLINAIAAGRVHGVQFKRGHAADRKTFDDLRNVIGDRLDGARRVAVQDALREANDTHPVMKTRAENERLRAAIEGAQQTVVVLREALASTVTCVVCQSCLHPTIPHCEDCSLSTDDNVDIESAIDIEAVLENTRGSVTHYELKGTP